MKKIFVSSRSFGRFSKEPEEMIKKIAEIEKSTFGRPLKEEDLVDVLPKYDGIIVGVDEITKRALESSDRLKVVAKHGAGVDNIDLKSATERGVIVTYVPGANAESVADFTIGLILALARNIVPAHQSTKEGKWESRKFMGTEIYEKSLGIIGIGTIGKKVVKRAKGFDMKIICNTGHPEKHKEFAGKYGIEFVDLPTLLKESDIVSIHCSLNAQTEGLIGEKEFSIMKDTAFLINTARGPIVDEDAAYKALKEKKIAGAAFDVYKKEPPGASNPLYELDNVVLAPHIGSYTTEALNRVDIIQAQDIIKALSGERPQFVANSEIFE